MWSKMTDEYVQSDGTLQKVSKWRPVNKEGSFNDLVRGITPNTIAYRNRSCFCYPCRNSYGSQCLHDEICGSWKVFKLQKQNVVQSQSNLEDSLDVSPICSNSKAQTISFTHQKYIVNSCVIVKYGEIFYPGVVIEVLDDQRRNNFLKRHRNKRNIFVYPEVQDIQLVYADMIVTEVMLIPMAIV
ncbi:uncharacterized protein LOC129924548 [Biomphalaria glabrata]|uniref:Uncharacterized protein LOC129924548 n=1 Tax=Biomphalaria glabrata TaxID=6526 RepID=A0A9W2ZLJ9_BIOGL|nr:uncharacterized protein LOC129924548 [Biomphalaria glabrata]XP_055875846.1 uncharacterized protein LOC129924548 [Biomphalaria glabrata]XP_055875847.1 uncharacterized protein LOC129924548 [Biomphalaria glabrata]